MADAEKHVDKNAQAQMSLFGGEATPAPDPSPASQAPRVRHAELNRILSHAAYAYYALDDPEMTDAAFDRLLQELLALEAEHPELVTPESYTQRVGGYVSEQFEPVTHAARMYSMDDAMDPRRAGRVARPHRRGPRRHAGAPGGLHLRAQDRRPRRGPHLHRRPVRACRHARRRHHRRERHGKRPHRAGRPPGPRAGRPRAPGRRRPRPLGGGPWRGLHAAALLRPPERGRRRRRHRALRQPEKCRRREPAPEGSQGHGPSRPRDLHLRRGRRGAHRRPHPVGLSSRGSLPAASP